MDVIRAGRKFRRDTVIDVEKGEISGGEVFTVVDPVDRKRNVAANLSLDNLARFVQRCRGFLSSPNISYFVRQSYGLDSEEIEEKVIEELGRRYVYCLITKKPGTLQTVKTATFSWKRR